jgi:hypothetical protein
MVTDSMRLPTLDLSNNDNDLDIDIDLEFDDDLNKIADIDIP